MNVVSLLLCFGCWIPITLQALHLSDDHLGRFISPESRTTDTCLNPNVNGEGDLLTIVLYTENSKFQDVIVETLENGSFTEVIPETECLYMNDCFQESYVIACEIAHSLGNTNTSYFVDAEKKHIPDKPPDLNKFSFYLIRPSNTLDNLVIYITWKPLPKEVHGGDYLIYVLEVISRKWHYKTNVTTSYALINNDIHASFLNVKIWAANEIGITQNYSEIFIRTREPHKSRAYAEFSETGDVKIYVKSNSVVGVQKIAFQVCGGGLIFAHDLCFEELATKVLDLNNADLKVHDILEFVVPYKSRINKVGSNKIKYLYLQNQNDSFKLSSKEKPSILYHPNSNNMENLLNDSSETSSASMAGERYRKKMTYEEIKNKKVFMSVMEDGDWTGLAPISCYFSDLLGHELPQVKLNITQFDDSAELNSVHLSFRQECPHRPNQFMAKYFTVYSTSSPNCNNERHIIANLRNKIFDDVQTKIPKETKHICIEIIGQNNLSDVSGPVVIILRDGDKNLAISLGSILTFLLVSIISASSVVAFKHCKRRKRTRSHSGYCVEKEQVFMLPHLNVCNASSESVASDDVSNTFSEDTHFNQFSCAPLLASSEDNIHVQNGSVSSDSEINTDI